MTPHLDPLGLAQALIRCPSVTPIEGGALDLLQQTLEPLGFVCHRLPFASVDNLYARIGSTGPNFCFAGHADVVPVGDAAAWTVEPFAGVVEDGRLWGRGAADMKAAVACFVVAAARYLEHRRGQPEGSISLLITGDEEGPAVNGTVKVLEWLRHRGETLDACLVGEPTSPTLLGQALKIGRRGSYNAKLTVFGTQGHSAYPERADNPLPRLARLLQALDSTPLDAGTEHFQPSTLALTSIDVGNAATNVIPGQARAAFNIRYNDLHTPASLEAWIRRHCDAIGGRYELQGESSGDAFVTPPGRLGQAIQEATEHVTGLRPELSTSGGTSDARFIKDHCPVAEFGMVGATSHKVDESIPVADVERLTEIYLRVLQRVLAPGQESGSW